MKDFLKALFSGGDVVKAVGDAGDELFTSDEERLEKELETYKAERDYDYKHEQLRANQNLGQMEVNKEEAKGNWFQSGWRPAVGWTGAISLFMQYVVYQVFVWWAAITHPGLSVPPPLDAAVLMALVSGMLGIGAYRSYDKKNGVDTK